MTAPEHGTPFAPHPTMNTTRLRACEIAMGTARNLLQVARETFDLKPTHRAHEVEAACALAVVWAAHLATIEGWRNDTYFEEQVATANYYIDEAARDLENLSQCRFAGVMDR